MRAAHHLGNDAYLGVVKNVVEIVRNEMAKGTFGKVAQVKNVLYIYFFTKLLFKNGAILCQHLGNARADNAKSKYSNVNHSGSFPRHKVPKYTLVRIINYCIIFSAKNQ